MLMTRKRKRCSNERLKVECGPNRQGPIYMQICGGGLSFEMVDMSGELVGVLFSPCRMISSLAIILYRG